MIEVLKDWHENKTGSMQRKAVRLANDRETSRLRRGHRAQP